MIKRLSFRFVSLLLILALIPFGNISAQAVNEAAPATSSNQNVSPKPSPTVAEVKLEFQTISSYDISIPKECGTIDEVYQDPKSTYFIVHIQNTHANYEAQKNIKEILNYLVPKYKFPMVLLEGAVSKLDPGILRPSYLDEANLKLSDLLMREGRLTGADAYAVETKEAVDFYGVEDQSLYMENLGMFRSIYEYQKEMAPYFEYVDHLIREIGIKLLDRELQRFVSKTRDYRLNHGEMLDYLNYLNDLGKKHNLVSLDEPGAMFKYPNLVRMIRLEALEKRVDQKALSGEEENLKKELLSKNGKLDEELDQLLGQLDHQTKGMKPRIYFEKLTEAVSRAGGNFVSYAQIRYLAEFLILQDEIEHEQLFDELKKLEQYLQNQLFASDDQKIFLQLIDSVNLLEQYFRLEMSRDELRLYLQNEDKIKPSWVASKVDILAQKYQIPAKSFGDVDKFDSYVKKLEYYYELVLKRDQVFMENIIKKFQSTNSKMAILVTGGFHREGLSAEYKKRNISYVVISPKSDVEQTNEKYVKVMLDQDIVVGSVVAGTFALEVRNMLEGLFRTQKDLWRLGALDSATGALTRHLDNASDDSQFRKQMDKHLNGLGIGKFETLAPKRERNVITIQVKADLVIQNKTERYLFTARLNTQDQSFEVASEPPFKEDVANQNAPIAPAQANYDMPNLGTLGNQSPSSKLVLNPPMRLADYFVLGGTVLIAPTAARFITEGPARRQLLQLLEANQRGNASLLQQVANRAVDKNEQLGDMGNNISTAGAANGFRQYSFADLDRAAGGSVSGENAERLKLFSQDMPRHPGVMVIPIPSAYRAELRLALVKSAIEVAQTRGIAVVLIGNQVSALMQGLSVDKEVAAKIRAVDIQGTSEEALMREVGDFIKADRASRFYELVRPSIEGNPRYSRRFVRVLVSENALAQLQEILKTIPTFLTPSGEKMTPELAWLAVQMLPFLPSPSDQSEIDAFYRLLNEYQFAAIIVPVGNHFGFGAGVAALVARIYADYLNVKALIIMA